MAITRCPHCTNPVHYVHDSSTALLNSPFKALVYESKELQCSICDHKFDSNTKNESLAESDPNELRLYSVCNMYFSGIHAGIQTQHSTVELLQKYKGTVHEEYISKWADEYKTTIVLNGGMQDSMELLLDYLERSDIPYSEFYEIGVHDKAISSISFILSASEYNLIRSRNEQRIQDLYENEPYVFLVLNHISNLQLAK